MKNIKKSNILDKIKKLYNILENSNINHNTEIIKESTLKDAHIYCKINQFSGQVSGALIENYIKVKYNMTKNKASSCIGDLNKNNVNLEIKVSNGGKHHNKFNYVQIRMNHSCDYMLTAYYLHTKNVDRLGELFVFRLNKNNIKNLIFKYGSYAHGTIKKLGIITKEDLNNIENSKEYALRPTYGDPCWRELLQFRIDEMSI